jgi:predicted 3-demethylubiquinone-9 3-methyltransferase (glyoxalase superfamily)
VQDEFHRISMCLWFDHQAEEAARFYTSVFPNSRITETVRYTKEGAEPSGQPEGSVMTVAFELDGMRFAALNGGPIFQFTEAMSIVVHCKSQAEVDHYWNALSKGGPVEAQQCGWLKDRYGVSWQIVPDVLFEYLRDPDPEVVKKATAAMMKMKKLDENALRAAVAAP